MKWGRAAAQGAPSAPEVLVKRLGALSTPVVRDWAGHYLNVVGDMLLQHSRQGDPIVLQEAEDAGIALLAAVRELKSRQ